MSEQAYCLTDTALIDNVQEQDGRIVVNARVARGGNVQDYLGPEMGVQDKDVVRVFRPESEVFDEQSTKTFPHKFITLEHPSGKADFSRDAVGWIGDSVMRDGEFIRVPMLIAHGDAIDAVKSGKRELSVGYKTAVDFTPGTSPSGEEYDAIMRDIVVDHVAIVDQARGGTELRIGDWSTAGTKNHPSAPESKEEPLMSDTKLKTVLVDGLSVETTDAGAQAIDKLQSEVKDARAKLDDTEAKHAEALKAKDTELAKKDAEIDDLKGKQMDEAALDAAVKERGDLIATAKTVADKDYTGKSADEIRKTAVEAKLGSDSVKDKSPEYIEARFDILAEDADADPVRKVVRSGANTGDSDKAYDEYVQRTQDAWKGDSKEVH